MAESLAQQLEQKLPGFKASFGGEELKRATAALGGALDARKGKSPTTSAPASEAAAAEEQPSAPAPATAADTVATVLAQTCTPDATEADLVLRELALAANQYSRAEAGADPSSGPLSEYDVAYNHGLVLQELAGKLAGSQAEQQLQLLEQACELYAAASAARPSAHSALYNWGVALSDLARLLREGRPAEALHCLQQASHKYAGALDLQPGNPQALNNWGLVLQEMSALATSVSERDRLVAFALEKFRHALRLRPDFDRGVYNLGTVLYTYACAVQADLTAQLKAGRLASSDPATTRERHARETRVRSLFTAAAQYICLAAALQPSRDIYRRSLAVVKPMLPLPFLRAGYLTAPLEAGLGGPGETWRREWFVLDQGSLRSASAMESSLSSATSGGGAAIPTLKIGHAVGESPLVVPLDAILSVRRVFDPSLPEGEALWLHLSRPVTSSSFSHPHAALPASASAPPAAASAASHHHSHHHSHPQPHPQPPRHHHAHHASSASHHHHLSASTVGCAPPCCSIWLVADDPASADAWVDALLLAHHIVASRSPSALAEALTPPAPGPAAGIASAPGAGAGAAGGRTSGSGRVSGGGGPGS
ncbi:hypothetical protein HYH03_011445 [Edaphochlamys debaryana]|uniref:PH domain-containing protein n=1 Tax=Edaphochlamys debaryana TaxID=47281 RepID=A0A835XUS1_9CHLO|nr:hypothetical protein HYH03_011445 [Edaphochlamys debaryana]|eukprot:KAG2490140.1 hypothetical protein HYH03_011445 [Edaphochlamys debaryana]